MGGVAKFVSNVGGAVGDVVGGAADAVGDVVEDVVDVADDVWDTASDVVEDAWDNDLVRTAAIAATAYYGGGYLLGSAGTASAHPLYGTYAYSGGSGILGAAASAFPQTYASLSSFGAGAFSAAKTVGLEVGKNVAGQMIAGSLGGGAGGGGGGAGFAPVRLNKGAATTYGDFRARAAELGINADVANGMMKVANSDLEAIQQFRRDVNRTATLGPTIELGSAQLGGIGVRNTTRGIS